MACLKTEPVPSYIGYPLCQYNIPMKNGPGRETAAMDATSEYQFSPHSKNDRMGFRQYSILAILLTLCIFSYLDRSMIYLVIDPIKHSLKLSELQLGLLQGVAFAVFYAIFGLPMGWLADHISRRWLIWGGVTFWSLASGACGLATSFLGLAIARFGVGVGEATLNPTAYATISTELPKRRVALGLAIFTLGSSVGTGLALIGGGYLVHWAQGLGPLELPILGHVLPWQLAFLITAPLGIVVAFLAFLLPKNAPHPKTADAMPAAFRKFLSSRRRYLICNIAGVCFQSSTAYAAGAWAPTYLMRVHGVSVAQAGLLIGTVTVFCGIVAVLIAALIADRAFSRGRDDAHQLIAICSMVGVLITATLGFSLDAPVAVIMILIGLAHGFVSMSNPIAAHIQLTAPVAFRGRVAAIKVMCQQLVGLSVGPAMVALITDKVFDDPKAVGYSVALTILILAPLSILFFFLARAPSIKAAAESRDW